MTSPAGRSGSAAAIEAGIERAAAALAGADALLVAAGAGMGVDSGLPDFRGDDGFWKAYPPAKKLGLRFSELANPRWFADDPELAWGFYGHRLELYRRTKPHQGFEILRAWAGRAGRGHFVFTSNIDGHFQRAGFAPERVVECHGSIHVLQCSRPCGRGTYPADGVRVDVDIETLRARPPLPACPACGALARPNVLMFGDWAFDGGATGDAVARLEAWIAGLAGAGREPAKLVVVECGAGGAIPTVRRTCEAVAAEVPGALLVRINVREPLAPAGQLGLPLPALAALQRIDARLRGA